MPAAVQLAQRDEPVEEERLQDEHVDQKAAKSHDSETFDKGNIAPDPSMQSDKMPDPKKQEHGDAEYWLMQPVYSKEYTESVKPRHIPAEKASTLFFCTFSTNTSIITIGLIRATWHQAPACVRQDARPKQTRA